MAVVFAQGPAPRPGSIRLPGSVVVSGVFALGGNARGPERARLVFELQEQTNVGFRASNPKSISTQVVVPPNGRPFDFPIQLLLLPRGEPVSIIIIRATVDSIDDPGFPHQDFVQITIDRT